MRSVRKSEFGVFMRERVPAEGRFVQIFDFTPKMSELRVISYLRRVRRAIPKRIPLAYADGGRFLHAKARELAPEIDIALANIHPYWGKQPIDKAMQNLYETYRQLVKAYPKKRVVIGETGWPSAGLPRGEAMPGEEQELTFIRALSKLSKAHPEMKCFFFDAFDEPFKRGGETNVEPYWGVYDTTGKTKPSLVSVIPDLPPLQGRLNSLKRASENKHQVMRAGKLFAGFEVGLDTNKQQRTWLKDKGDSLEMNYPAGQAWGAVFFVAGRMATDEQVRDKRDYSEYDSLAVELKGGTPGESTEVGVKSADEPSNGREPKYTIKNIPTEWQEYSIPLSEFQKPGYPAERMKSLYVVTEFVFKGTRPHCVSVRNIRYTQKQKPAPKASEGFDIYVGKALTEGFDMGVNTSGSKTDWVEDHEEYMECRYPEGQGWGAIFITVGTATEDKEKRETKDFSKYKFLTLDIKGEEGGEKVSVGFKTRNDPDDGKEPKYALKEITKEWKKMKIPLSKFDRGKESWKNRLKTTYVACELVFEGKSARTVSYRNIRYEE